MKPFECKWFACVYAMKPKCVIDGYLSEPNEHTGQREICTNYKDTECIRARCEYCRRLGGKGVCPIESEV